MSALRDLCTFLGAYALVLVAMATLIMLARAILVRWLAWRARRAACRHPHEALNRGTWAHIELRCLDCGQVRHLGAVYFGASNRTAHRGPTA